MLIKWKWLVGCLAVISILGLWYVRDSRSVAILRPHGKAEFYRGGVFHRDKFELSVRQGHWFIFRAESAECGQLIVPFECPYNETRVLRLEEGGKAYTLDKKAFTREELRVVSGEWSYDADDHWQSIFDLFVP